MKLTEDEIKCLIFGLNISKEQIDKYIEDIKWYKSQKPKKAEEQQK
jgi:hypothetical protein